MPATFRPVYRLRFSLAMPDPDMPQPRYHTTIYAETNQGDQIGFVHHVTGDITSTRGMQYERRPENSMDFYDKELLGHTPAAGYPTSFDYLLSKLPTPPQQKEFNIATMRTEPFKTLDPLTFYETREARRPLIKCTEWVSDCAIPALQAAGLLVIHTEALVGAV
ncbi:hypothetical protein EJ08DRAFT_586945 [Tothia fuscella]|uniref:Uncharacterized protein n=1 Tax=Tothia fuscella TaxID=1048955 RepID=A0A9P4NU22_9PEZI|nr:hypothetical protein EJ08DRAFT_586945 [Tothia fuscella]